MPYELFRTSYFHNSFYVPNMEVYNQLTKLTDKLADEAYEADVRKYWGTVGNKADEIIENYYKTKYGSDYQNHMKK